jgi:hypothetical protein
MPEMIVRRVVEQVGMESADEEVYKLLAVLADHSLANLFSSIRNTRANTRKHKEEDAQLLLTKEVIRELKLLGCDPSKTYQCPILFYKKEDEDLRPSEP